MLQTIKNHYDVIVIGGGATGAGTARDCAMRGLKTLLVERKDFTAGATGRNHGLLHSGARYAVTDQESASECISENMILRRIARHCVEETGGLFITLPEDDLSYQAKFVESCQKAGISAEILDPKEAIRMEPSVNPDIIGAVRVPDGAVDPFRLTTANIVDARLHGADIITYNEVVGFVRNQNRIEGVNLRHIKNGTESTYYADVVINACGIWGAHVAELAGLVTADCNTWSSMAILVLMFLMFVCACAGSTSGGLKIDRLLLAFKMLRNRLRQQQHPGAVFRTKVDGIPQNKEMLDTVLIYTVAFLIMIFAGAFVNMFLGSDLMTGFSSALACASNVGPGFGDVGTMDNYSETPALMKVNLSLLMLLGRLEIFGLLQLFFIRWWK